MTNVERQGLCCGNAFAGGEPRLRKLTDRARVGHRIGIDALERKLCLQRGIGREAAADA
jgi:hypothetical protein